MIYYDLSTKELSSGLTYLFGSGLVKSLEVAEVNPVLDADGETSRLVVGLVSTVLKV